jgi:F420-0:gamma-glutamyl ligase-like protein
MRKDEKPAASEGVNAFSVPDFCARNAMCPSTAYKLARMGMLEIRKQLGKAVVTIEDESAYRKLLRENKLASPVEKGAGRGKRAKAQQPGTAA